MKRYAKYAGIGLLILLLIAGFYTWNPHPAAPSAESLAASADQYDVEIIRDESGVPHIYGKTDADAAFGMGYAHAEDDFATIQERVIAVRGEMANIKGADAAITDYLVSLFEVWETVDAKYESDVPQNIKDISKAYADGLNLYASQHPEELAPGFRPFTEEDATAGSIFELDCVTAKNTAARQQCFCRIARAIGRWGNAAYHKFAPTHDWASGMV